MSPKKRFVKAYLTEEEYHQIIGQSRKAGLSASKFVKRVCLAQEVRSTIDQDAVLALIQSKGDLGRLGGLLKQHLSETGGNDTWHDDLRTILRSIEARQREMAKEFSKVTELLLQGKKK